MKKLLIIIATLACVMAVTTSAFAESSTISITATVSGTQGVTLTPTATWAIGSIDAGATSASSAITATNSGTAPESLELSAATAGHFTVGSTPDADQISIWGKCASVDPGLTATNVLSDSAGQTSASVNPGSGLKVWMQYNAPTSISAGKTNGAVDVTVSTLP